MLIVGWGHRKVKVIGPTEKRVCPRCTREDFWDLVEVRHFATLFFVPLIPYKREHFLRCPVCELVATVPPEQLAHRQQQADNLLSQLHRKGPL
jgi:hypothetical protein